MSIDEIIEETKLAPSKVTSTLTGLEIKKIIKNLGGTCSVKSDININGVGDKKNNKKFRWQYFYH